MFAYRGSEGEGQGQGRGEIEAMSLSQTFNFLSGSDSEPLISSEAMNTLEEEDEAREGDEGTDDSAYLNEELSLPSRGSKANKGKRHMGLALSVAAK